MTNKTRFVAGDGGGAGNNWAIGFASGQQHFEKICDIIDREAEVLKHVFFFFWFGASSLKLHCPHPIKPHRDVIAWKGL